VTVAERKFQFYGRRKGKPLRRHHLELMQQRLPALRLKPDVLGGDAPVWLEIGFGGGEHLAHQAALHPEVQFIGAEPFVNGVAKLLAEIERRSLCNVAIHDDDARYLLPLLPPASLERIYLLYPDPWPKARQNKRRFVNSENLAEMARVVKPGGLFLFASDIADYVDWTLSNVAAAGAFRLVSRSHAPFDDWVRTRYEAKAIREGRIPQYLAFRRDA
jgi:tRNA (guanine-N7-)-methyltransferase